MKNLPRVTVIIPGRNEELWIGKFSCGIYNQLYYEAYSKCC